MKSLALLVVLLIACAGSSMAQLPQIQYIDSDSTAKRLNIGADPVMSAGFPADSLGDSLAVYSFDFEIWIKCLDAHGRQVEGFVDKFEPLVVTIPPVQVTSDTLMYLIRFVQRCGNPVLGSAADVWIGSPQPMPVPPLIVDTKPPTILSDTLPPPPEPPPKKGGGWSIPMDGWIGIAGSKSLESRARYAFEGLYIDFPLSSRWTLKTALASSQANFWRNGGRIVHRGLSGDMSRWQVGLSYHLYKDAKARILAGRQYDHKNNHWQSGLVYEGWLGLPIWKIWNEENATYQSTTYAFWFRSRHMYPIAGSGDRIWYLGGEGVYNSFHENGEHWYTTRFHGLVKYDFPGIAKLPATLVLGIGRGGDNEAWGIIAELGHRLWF
ncbi:MAG: hypothetical protein V1853_03505 [bacterium]